MGTLEPHFSWPVTPASPTLTATLLDAFPHVAFASVGRAAAKTATTLTLAPNDYGL